MISQRLSNLPAPVLLVAPHHDDVALSCGGTAAALAAGALPPRIVTVFASELVHAMVGQFAVEKHLRWGLHDFDDIQTTRRAEDQAAAHVLGCCLRWLGLPDAIYRGERYEGDGALYGEVHDEEAGLGGHLAEELLNLPEWSPNMAVAVPLGVGSHVDHQICFDAGRHLASRGIEVFAYEDLPYAIHTPTALSKRLQQVGRALAGEVLVDIEPHLSTKIEAVRCYGTQVPVIFRFTEDWQAALTQYARRVGAGSAVERFWRVVG